MTELDKFKRRTIRSVSRMLQQKKPPDELWAQMKKELGTDCRVLWERMRALCIKKLNRMLAVDDRSDSLPSVARLTLTDWLLVDLVLVHENIDVIAMEKEDNKAEQKPLVELFNLVQRFEVEGRKGEALAEAWAAATVFYNRQGRQCSPMLLQRRWYQLKKLTRCRFYKFWQSYRGNTRLLDEAKATMPSRLMMAVAKRYPSVITEQFLDWEDLIKERLIVMPEEFEAKMRLPNLPIPCKSNDPDLVVVEPLIETIDLRLDSDPEDESKDDNDVDTSDPEKSNDAAPQPKDKGLLGVKIKTEPKEEDGLSNVQVVAATHVPEVDIRDDDNPEPIVEPVVEPDVEPTKQTEVKSEEKQNDSPDEDDVIEIPNVIPVVDVEIDSPTNNVTEKPQEEVPVTSSPDNILNDDAESDEVVDDFIKIKADEFCSNESNKVPEVTNEESLVDNIIKDKLENFLNTPKDVIFGEKKADPKAIELISEKNNLTALDLMADLNFVDDGIEFVDDGVEFVEDDDLSNGEPVRKSPTAGDSNEGSGNKFDLKLLMDPVVYTTRLDQMRIFSGKQFDSVENIEVIDKIVAESKPVSKKSFSINIKQEDITSQIDTEAADDAGSSDDLFTNKEDSSDDELPDSARVSITSNMLRKPKSISYNPIQLCKNPDFNTKLRRLNIGFFSSIRNRQLLNSCIPITIDVSKSFESKMIGGTLHLKRTMRPTVTTEPGEVANTVEPTVVPTTMPVQTPLDKVLTNIPDLPPPTVTPDHIVSERKKVISLPDIEKVRKINQQLLTAQVTPIRVYAGDSHQITAAATNDANQTKLTEQPVPTPPPESLNALPTIAKVKSEVSLDSKSDPEILVPEPELPPAKKKLIKIINRAKVLTQEALCKIDGGGTKAPVNSELKEFNLLREVVPKNRTKAPKNPTFQRVPVPWTSRLYPQKPEQIDDFLITSDTLNKMLHLMGKDTHDTNCTSCVNKPKPKKKKKKKSQKFDLQNPNNSEELVIAKGRVFKYCCWARQKLANRKRITKHTCPAEGCVCCCRDELAGVAIELSDDEDVNLQKACQSIESVVQQSRELTRAVVIENVSTVDVIDQSALVVAANETVIEVPAAPSPGLDQGRSCVNGATVRLALDAPTPEITLNVTTVQTPCTLQPSEPVNVTTGDTPLNVTAVQPSINVTAEQTPLIMLAASNLVSSQKSRPQTSPVASFVTTSKENQTYPTFPNVRTKIVAELPYIKPVPKPNFTPPPYVSCSCQKPAVTQGVQRNIVIDASIQCPIHKLPPLPVATPISTPKNESKVLYLHSKSISKSPSESPIYLGKNKILLTTVKFPRRDVVPDREVFQVPKIIPTLEMPSGVHLIMLASGCVTYTLDPGRVLSDAELASLPSIIAAVQEQLTSTCPPVITPVNTDINSLNTNSAIPAPEVNINIQTTELQIPINLQAEEVPEKVLDNVDSVSNVSNLVDDSVAPVTQPNETSHISGKENECTPSNEVVENTTNDKDATAVSNDTPLVSSAIAPILNEPETGAELNALNEKDTQEANVDDSIEATEKGQDSKKVTEDVVNSKETTENVEDSKEATEKKDETVAKEPPSNRKSLLSDLMEMSGISAEDTTVVEPPPLAQIIPENVISSVTLGVSGELVNRLGTNTLLTAEQTRSLPELSPVTSFAELKYACEQNGKFFKLDYESGVIVPINVCIKKNIKRKAQMQPKAVIDLTEDVEEEDNTNITSYEASQTPAQYIYNGKTVNVSVKPVKMFKACRPPLLKRSRLFEESDVVVPRKKSHMENRKQALNRLEARIDLVDSDEPMEEEYLLDSSDDEEPLEGMESMHVEALDLDILEDSGDSSDDEPLAKKSKRLKEAQPVVAENTIEANIRLAMDCLEENVSTPELAPEASDTASKDKEQSPMIYEDLSSKPNKEGEPVIKFMSVASENEGGEDDCILGV